MRASLVLFGVLWAGPWRLQHPVLAMDIMPEVSPLLWAPLFPPQFQPPPQPQPQPQPPLQPQPQPQPQPQQPQSQLQLQQPQPQMQQVLLPQPQLRQPLMPRPSPFGPAQPTTSFMPVLPPALFGQSLLGQQRGASPPPPQPPPQQLSQPPQPALSPQLRLWALLLLQAHLAAQARMAAQAQAAAPAQAGRPSPGTTQQTFQPVSSPQNGFDEDDVPTQRETLRPGLGFLPAPVTPGKTRPGLGFLPVPMPARPRTFDAHGSPFQPRHFQNGISSDDSDQAQKQNELGQRNFAGRPSSVGVSQNNDDRWQQGNNRRVPPRPTNFGRGVQSNGVGATFIPGSPHSTGGRERQDGNFHISRNQGDSNRHSSRWDPEDSDDYFDRWDPEDSDDRFDRWDPEDSDDRFDRWDPDDSNDRPDRWDPKDSNDRDRWDPEDSNDHRDRWDPEDTTDRPDHWDPEDTNVRRNRWRSADTSGRRSLWLRKDDSDKDERERRTHTLNNLHSLSRGNHVTRQMSVDRDDQVTPRPNHSTASSNVRKPQATRHSHISDQDTEDQEELAKRQSYWTRALAPRPFVGPRVPATFGSAQ